MSAFLRTHRQAAFLCVALLAAVVLYCAPSGARKFIAAGFGTCSFFIFTGTFAANTHLNEGSYKLIEQAVSLLDITGTATSYMVKTGGTKTDVKGVDSTGQYGQHRGSDFSLGKNHGTLTLQFVNPTDNPPTPLQFFSALDSTGSAKKYMLLGVGEKYGIQTETMLDCDIQLVASQAGVTASLPSQTAT